MNTQQLPLVRALPFNQRSLEFLEAPWFYDVVGMHEHMLLKHFESWPERALHPVMESL